MMFSHLKKLKKDARLIHLTNEEKTSMDKHVLEFVAAHPMQTVRMEKDTRHTLHGQTLFFSFLHKKYMFASLIVLLVVALGGGVSYAAEGSIPGQPLYPVKQFNEEVKAVITVSPQADAEWNTRRVERRLEEASALSAQGKLDAKIETQLSNDLKVQVKETEKEIQALEKNGNLVAAADLSARLKTALSVHESILTSFEEQEKKHEDKKSNDNSDNNKENRPVIIIPSKLLEQVKLHNGSAGEIKLEIDNRVHATTSTESSVSGKITSAKNKVAEVRKFMTQKESTLSEEAKAKAQAELAIADTLIVQAEAKLSAGMLNEAFIIARQAHEKAQEVKLIIDAQNNFKGKLDIKDILDHRNSDEQKLQGKVEIKINNNTLEIHKDDDGDKDERDENKNLKLEGKPIEIKINSSGLRTLNF